MSDLTALLGSTPGVDTTWVDPAVRPQDDFFAFVNGRWLAEHVIPADRSRDGVFHVLRDEAEQHVREIIERAPADSRIGALYRSFMDEAAVTAAGIAPLAPDLDAVLDAADRDALAVALGALARLGVPGPIAFYVNNDAGDTTRHVVWLTQSGLGLPDESYYRDQRHAATLTAYGEHVATMLRLSGLAERAGVAPQAAAARIVAFESALAGAHRDVVAFRDAVAAYNPRSLAELAAEAPGFPWRAWVEALGGSAETCGRLIVRQPEFATALARLWAEAEIADLRLWAGWRVVAARAPYLPAPLADADFGFYGRTLTGAPEQRARWKRGVTLVEGFLGEEVGREYVSRHFPPGHRAQMQALVDDLLEAYRRRITDLDWMTPATRARALEKLAAFTPKIGYPDRWRDYGALALDPTDLLGNIRRGSAHEHDHDLGKLGAPVDRGEWHMTPQTVNAYYNPVMNEIVFPAAILRPPFFDIAADAAVNYGAIGAVIGHEIGHGFDDQGSAYDGAGNLSDWWTAADRAAFGERTAALIAQYDAYTPTGLDPEVYRVNGAFTVGENIGDLGGLGIALVAWDIARERAGGPVAAAVAAAGLRRVFWSWATVWRTAVRPAEAIRLLSIDPHSPAEFRCNGVLRNLDAFHEAFGVGPGDALWLDPAERVRIW